MRSLACRRRTCIPACLVLHAVIGLKTFRPGRPCALSLSGIQQELDKVGLVNGFEFADFSYTTLEIASHTNLEIRFLIRCLQQH